MVKNEKKKQLGRLYEDVIKVMICLILTIFVSMNLGYYLGQKSTEENWKQTPIEKLFIDYNK